MPQKDNMVTKVKKKKKVSIIREQKPLKADTKSQDILFNFCKPDGFTVMFRYYFINFYFHKY